MDFIDARYGQLDPARRKSVSVQPLQEHQRPDRRFAQDDERVFEGRREERLSTLRMPAGPRTVDIGMLVYSQSSET